MEPNRTGVAGVDANRIEPRRDPVDTGAVGPVRPFRIADLEDRLVAAGLTEQEVEAIPDWDMNNRECRDLADNDSIEVGVRE